MKQNKPKKQKSESTNCTFTNCTQYSICTTIIDTSNYLEAMTLRPNCFEEQVKIEIKKPVFKKPTWTDPNSNGAY